MSSDWIDSLTRREIEVLRLLDARLSNEEIAAVLHLPPEAIRRHGSHIYRKFRRLPSRAPEGESPGESSP